VKALGGIIGMVIGGLFRGPLGIVIGFILGSLIGHYAYDEPREQAASNDELTEYKRRQGRFLFFVMSLSAKLAKADAYINRSELNFIERLMRQNFRLNDSQRNEAIRVWNAAKDTSDSFEQIARQFYQQFSAERHQVSNLLDVLFAMAAADGSSLHPKEEELLLKAAGIFHVSRLQYERIKSRHFFTQARYQQAYSTLDPHYAILGAQPSDTLEVIKKKYRALAMKWHPDRMAANGASPDAQRHAKEKFQQINEAYERIVEAKKV
jgi:DnaJ like chaperone protein